MLLKKYVTINFSIYHAARFGFLNFESAGSQMEFRVRVTG